MFMKLGRCRCGSFLWDTFCGFLGHSPTGNPQWPVLWCGMWLATRQTNSQALASGLPPHETLSGKPLEQGLFEDGSRLAPRRPVYMVDGNLSDVLACVKVSFASAAVHYLRTLFLSMAEPWPLAFRYFSWVRCQFVEKSLRAPTLDLKVGVDKTSLFFLFVEETGPGSGCRT